MQSYLIDWLVCPACHSPLEWEIHVHAGDRVESALARCQGCGADYPVREGIGLFLPHDAGRDDLWERAESGLSLHLRQHPEIERQLMEPPLEELPPADRFFRAMALEGRGHYLQAKEAEESARQGLYTKSYLACERLMIRAALELLADRHEPVIDLASGRGVLVERMAREIPSPIVATDISPRVLRKDRARLQAFGLYERISLLAFDARRTPFRDRSLPTLTSYLGLMNIQHPGQIFEELRRVVSGKFLSINHFFPEDDLENQSAIDKLGLSKLLYRRPALEQFTTSGWDVEVMVAVQGRAYPTPKGVIIQGATIDGLPTAETLLDWCLLNAR